MMLFSLLGGVSFGGRLRARGSGCGHPKATPPSLRLHTSRAYLTPDRADVRRGRTPEEPRWLRREVLHVPRWSYRPCPGRPSRAACRTDFRIAWVRQLHEERGILSKPRPRLRERQSRFRPRIRVRDRTPSCRSRRHFVPGPECLPQQVLRVAHTADASTGARRRYPPLQGCQSVWGESIRRMSFLSLGFVGLRELCRARYSCASSASVPFSLS